MMSLPVAVRESKAFMASGTSLIEKTLEAVGLSFPASNQRNIAAKFSRFFFGSFFAKPSQYTPTLELSVAAIKVSPG